MKALVEKYPMSRRPAHTTGQLVFQEGKQIDSEYYIVSIYDDSELRKFHIAAYELETDQTFVLTYSYSDFDSLFRFNADLLNPNNSDGRFHWAVERLDFIEDGGRRGLVLAQEPTKISGHTVSSYQSLKKQPEQSVKEEDDATLLFTKSEAARLKFLQELHSKFSLQQLKSRQRLLLLDEDMNKRRARLDATKHSLALKSKIIDERNRTKSSTIAEIEQLMRKKEEETVKRLLRDKDRVKRELERRRQEALERRSNKEKTSRSSRKQELERKEILERKRKEVEEQRTILLKKLARTQVTRRQTLQDKINQYKLRLVEAKRNRLATLEKAVADKHERRDSAAETQRAVLSRRNAKERKREQIRREVERDRVVQIKEGAKQTSTEQSLRRREAVDKQNSRETQRLTLRKQRKVYAQKLEKIRAENISKKLELRRRKEEEGKWRSELHAVAAPTATVAAAGVADEDQKEKDKWMRNQDKEARGLERTAKRQEELTQAKAVLREDEAYRKAEEAKKFSDWKSTELKRLEQQQFKKIEQERQAMEQREREQQEARERYRKIQQLEQKREQNEKLKEQRRVHSVIEKVKTLPPALAISL